MWPAPLYIIFPHCPKYGTIFEKKVNEYKKCVLISYTNFVWNIYHYKKNWAKYDKKCILVFMEIVKFLLFLSDFNETWIFSKGFRKTLEYQI